MDAAGRQGRSLHRHDDLGSQAGQCSGCRGLFRPSGQAHGDEPADRRRRADGRADGAHRACSGQGLRSRRARLFRSRNPSDRAEAGAAGNGCASQAPADNGRLALLHRGCRQLGHGLPYAGHGQPARPRLEPARGCRLSAEPEGRCRRRLRRGQARLRRSLRQGRAAAGAGVLVADDV